MRLRTINVLIAIIVLALYALSVSADPTGFTSINGTPETRTSGIDSSSGVPVEADAGNMTSLFVNTTQITDRWQGFYGNVTGIITLDTADEWTLYDWKLTSPEGEIYAVNGSTTPSWANVECLQFNRSVTTTDLTDLQTNLGMSVNEDDNINNTFNITFGGAFSVGLTNDITADDNCSFVSLHVNDQQDSTNFNETILFDGTNNENLIIYTTLLEQDATGFSGSALDFQMIVGENGDSDTSTTYWFYVELN